MLRVSLALLACLSLLAGTLRAGFILDDFDDPAEVVSPEMESEFVQTNNVGLLNATRNIRIAATTAFDTQPIATLSTAKSSSSFLSANLLDIGLSPLGSPLFAFQFNYAFSPTDISAGGANNAIIFDFRSIEANAPPTFLRVIVRDDTNNRSSFEARVLDLPLSSGTFTAVMPFDSFTLRGGSPGLPDFTTIDEMEFDFFFQRPRLDIQWSAELERVRFGRIPEPLSHTLFTLGVVSLASCRCCYRR